MSGHSYDFSALEDEPGPQDVRRQHRPTAKYVFYGLGGVLTVIFGIATVVDVAQNGADDLPFGLGFVVGGLVLAGLFALLARFFDRRGAERSARIAAFARANGFQYAVQGKASDLPGVPRRRQPRATLSDRVRWNVDGAPAEAAYYTHVSSGTETSTTTCHYLAVKLGVDVDPVTFDCGRGGPSASGTQRWGPDAFEADHVKHEARVAGLRLDPRVRVLFDDAVVAVLTDEDWPWNAEYEDGWFVAYPRGGNRADPDRWRATLALAEAVAARRAALA